MTWTVRLVQTGDLFSCLGVLSIYEQYFMVMLATGGWDCAAVRGLLKHRGCLELRTLKPKYQ